MKGVSSWIFHSCIPISIGHADLIVYLFLADSTVKWKENEFSREHKDVSLITMRCQLSFSLGKHQSLWPSVFDICVMG